MLKTIHYWLFLASSKTQRPKVVVGPIDEALFVREGRTALRNLSGYSDLSQPRKKLYRKIVVGSASDFLSERHGWTAEEVRSHWNWALGLGFLNNSQFSLTWRLARNTLPLLPFELQSWPGRHARLWLLRQWLRRNGRARLLLPQSSSPVLVSRWGVDDSQPKQPKQLVLLDVDNVVDSVLSPFQGEKRVVFLAILVVA